MRGEYSFQYVIVHTTKKGKKTCSLQGHGKGCEHTSVIPVGAEALGDLILPLENEEKYDFILADYECTTTNQESENITDMSEEAKV